MYSTCQIRLPEASIVHAKFAGDVRLPDGKLSEIPKVTRRMFQTYTLRAESPMCSTKLSGQNANHEKDQNSSGQQRSGLLAQ